MADPKTTSDTYCIGTYNRNFAFLLLATLAVVFCFNMFIDPYLCFGTPRRAGWNTLKPKAVRQVRLAKANGVERGEFKTLFLGNSRIDIGLNPNSDSLPKQFRPAYNLGQPGTGSDVALLYLKHAAAKHLPNRVVIGADFLNFIRDPAKNASPAPMTSPIVTRLAGNEKVSAFARRRQQLWDVATSSLSMSASLDSLATIWGQRSKTTANIDDHGFNSGEAFRALIKTEGQASLFRQKNEEYISKCIHRQAPSEGESIEIRSLVEILEFCRQHQIQADVFVHPYHADILNIFEATGQWQEFENWKVQLARECKLKGARLWDFAWYSTAVTESPPDPKDRKTAMKWYWESGHYRSTLGDQILKKMFENSPDETFGFELTSENIPVRLEQIRTSQSRHWQAMPQQRERIFELISKQKKQLNSKQNEFSQ